MFEWVFEFILFLLTGYLVSFTLVGALQKYDVGAPKSNSLIVLKIAAVVAGLWLNLIFSFLMNFFPQMYNEVADGWLRYIAVYEYIWPRNAKWFWLAFFAGIFEEIYYEFRDNFGSD